MQQSNPDGVLSLPSELLYSIFGEWLDLKSVVAIDTAYCNVAKPKTLIETVFHSPQYILCKEAPAENTEKFINWVFCRGIRVKCLLLNGNIDPLICNDYLQQNGHSVKEIKMDYDEIFQNRIITQISKSMADWCFNMTSLIVSHEFFDQETFQNLSRCQALEDLRLYNCTCAAADIDSNMTDTTKYHADRSGQCKTRLKFDISCDFHLLRSLNNIKVLDFSSVQTLGDSDLLEIVKICPRIVHLDVSSNDLLRDSSGVPMVRGLTELKGLVVNQCYFSDAVLLALVAYRADTLEMLCTNDCVAMNNGVEFNTVLRDCHKLNAITLNLSDWEMRRGDATLLGNIQSLRTVNDTVQSVMLFETMIHHCHQLQDLRLRRNPFYPMFDLSVLVEGAPYLRYLGLSGETSFVQLREQVEAVRISRLEVHISYDWLTFHFDVMEIPC